MHTHVTFPLLVARKLFVDAVAIAYRLEAEERQGWNTERNLRTPSPNNGPPTHTDSWQQATQRNYLTAPSRLSLPQPFHSVTSTITTIHPTMAPAPTTRRPSRTRSSEHVLTHKQTAKRGLKRCASREAINPRERKRPRRDESGTFSLTRRHLHVVSVSNSRKRPSRDTFPRLFVWGCGDDGSLGLGPDHLEETPRPQHLRLGQRITSIAAGGLYTLLLDIDGKVSTPSA